MQFPSPLSLSALVEEFNLRKIGDLDLPILGINEINKVRPGDITFVDHPKYYHKALQSPASFILIDSENVDVPEGKCILVTDTPFDVYDALVARYRPRHPLVNTNIHPTALIDPTAVLETNVVVGAHVTIGADTYVRANTFIGEHTVIGARVKIDANTTIGSDAFYFQKQHGAYRQWTTGGRVIIEDDVYIGSSCNIARGVSGDTIIGQGTKLDALIQVGHGVVIGKNCLIASQVGIAGKTTIKDNVTIYGQVGIGQRLTIGENSTILGKTGVTKSLEPNKTYYGYVVTEARAQLKLLANLKKLSDSM